MTPKQHAPPIEIRREAGNWLVATRAMPELFDQPAEELLPRGASLPGNARLVRTAGGSSMLADVYLEDANEAAVIGEERLTRWLDGARSAFEAPNEELVESLLAERGATFERRDEAWDVKLADAEDVAVRCVEGGVRVEAVLVQLDDSGDAANTASDCRRALAEFLCRAQAGLRFARAELDSSSALVVSCCDSADLAADFERALDSVSWACRRLAAEARALANPAVAQNYLEFVSL